MIKDIEVERTIFVWSENGTFSRRIIFFSRSHNTINPNPPRTMSVVTTKLKPVFSWKLIKLVLYNEKPALQKAEIP